MRTRTRRRYASTPISCGDSSPFCIPGDAMGCWTRRSPIWRLIADRAPSCRPAWWARRRGARKPSCSTSCTGGWSNTAGCGIRLTHKGRNPLAPRLRRGMDIRHMTLAQYRYFRDVGLAGQLPTAEAGPRFRGRAPLRNRAAADLALCTGMRPEEWSTVMLPELGAGRRRPGDAVQFTVQPCAKYGKSREIYVPAGALDAVEAFTLLERPGLVAASARSLARRRRDLFVVDRIDHETGRLQGVLDGQRRTFKMPGMEPVLRRITMRETDTGLEPLAVFSGHGGWMLGPSSWYRIRCEAWERMRLHASHPAAPLLPRRRWRWHDTRHTFALQLLAYLEQQMDGDEPDAVVRRRRHMAIPGRPHQAQPAADRQPQAWALKPGHNLRIPRIRLGNCISRAKYAKFARVARALMRH